MSSLIETLTATLAEHFGVEPLGMTRLSGGASRVTWSFGLPTSTGVPDEMIVQHDRPGLTRLGISMATEAELVRRARDGGVAVADVVAQGARPDADHFGAWMVTRRVAGESIPRRILRDEELAPARAELATQCGAALGRIHRIETEDLGEDLDRGDPVDGLRDLLDLLGQPHPAFELGLRWLELHRPRERQPTLVHGDFRAGNLIIGPDGLRAVLDWELAHRGSPVEDLGWFCVRAWRFGSPHVAGGFGSVEQLLDGYRSVTGDVIGTDELLWWQLLGTIKWGIICVSQAMAHLLGLSRSVELAAIGRRACETELDVVDLLCRLDGIELGDSDHVPAADAHAEPLIATLHDRPTMAELIESVREFLEGDLLTRLDGALKYNTRVGINLLAMVERELLVGTAQETRHAERLRSLGVESVTALATAIRAREFGENWDDVLRVVAADVVDKVKVANPSYLER